MNKLEVFGYNKTALRVIIANDELWFVARDLYKIFDIPNASDAQIRWDDDALSCLDDDEKRHLNYSEALGLTDAPTKWILAVSESGMYALVFNSRNSEAKPFRKWVTSEVIPNLRKTGSYSVQTNNH